MCSREPRPRWSDCPDYEPEADKKDEEAPLRFDIFKISQSKAATTTNTNKALVTLSITASMVS